jgi:hypothetical protein
MGSDKNSLSVNAAALYELLKLVRAPAGKMIRDELVKQAVSWNSEAVRLDAVSILSNQYNDWAKLNTPPMLKDAPTGPTKRNAEYLAHAPACNVHKVAGAKCTCKIANVRAARKPADCKNGVHWWALNVNSPDYHLVKDSDHCSLCGLSRAVYLAAEEIRELHNQDEAQRKEPEPVSVGSQPEVRVCKCTGGGPCVCPRIGTV